MAGDTLNRVRLTAQKVVGLTREQLRRMDRVAVEKYGIPSIVLMENAARQAAEVIDQLGDVERRALVICGGGNNGGDGLAAARHMHNRGWEVAVETTMGAAKYSGDALVNWKIVEAMRGITRFEVMHGGLHPVMGAWHGGVVVDAIFGTGLDREPRWPFGEIARGINELAGRGAKIVAMDLPSGMDCDTGRPFGACVRAAVTVTFGAMKVGFSAPGAEAFTGRIVLADIGAPVELVEEVRG